MKIIKKMFIILGIIIGIIAIVGLLFLNLSPQFGGSATKAQQTFYTQSENYKDGQFTNLGNVNMSMSAGDMLKAIGGMFKTIPNAKPKPPIAVQKTDVERFEHVRAQTRLVWFGHSTFLMQIDGKNLLIDPMFGDVPAPHPLLGDKRFSKDLPMDIKQLPMIDAVLISHDHYDHLDYTSIKKLKDKVGRFFVPLGLGNHLTAWGVPEEKITELDWWQDAKLDGLTFTSTPAQHFSGRGLLDRNKTLWCSWVIQSVTDNIFFSGDGGYASHFKAIGNKFGPFDFAMMECGQYNELWSEIHMFPEETAQAAVDLNAKKLMPIHWGAFKLAQHAWTDPVERVSKKAEELNIELVTPQIGQVFTISDTDDLHTHWWNN